MFEKEAEEYIDKLTKDWSDGEYSFSVEQMRQAILHFAEFGYNKANEWHDLRKNPNDLPENKRNVWCDYGDGYGKGFYDKDDGSWWIEGHMLCSIIIAWYELPQFTDKE